jgi:hypothetical protein
MAKSEIVSMVVSMVRQNCPNGAFVKRCGPNDRWHEVNESVAREKVGYVFRDILCDRYRSSSASKAAQRRNMLKQELFVQEEIPSKHQHCEMDRSQSEKFQLLPNECLRMERTYQWPEFDRVLPTASFLVQVFADYLDEADCRA